MEVLMQPARGFTLWELLCTLGIAAVALTAGVPAFQTLVLDARLTADVNGWILAVQLARSEAAKRGRPVIVCKTDDTRRCGGADLPVDAGWMVYVNLDDDYPPQRSATEPLLYIHEPELTGTVTSNRPYYEFRPGRRSTNGTTVFCDRRGPGAAKAVIVSYTGRPRVDRVDADRRLLECAALT
jgi:type IV fimbrial biogenesis protein FimT